MSTKKRSSLTKTVTFGLVASMSCTTVACAPPQTARIRHGIIETPDVRIVGDSFELVAGEEFAPPFHTGNSCLIKPGSTNYGWALRFGARKVRVHHPDLDWPLYGVLALCGRPDGATGPASQSYMIQVPSSRVTQTEGGAVSVVSEYHQFVDAKKGSDAPKAWILWLSQLPLDEVDGLEGNSDTIAWAGGEAPWGTMALAAIPLTLLVGGIVVLWVVIL